MKRATGRYVLYLGAALTFNIAVVSQAQAQANVPPPPAKKESAAKQTLDAVSGVNSTTGTLFDAASAAGPKTAEVMKQAGKVSDGFGYVGVAITATQMAGNLYRGDTPAVIEQSVDLAVDAAMSAACAATGPAVAACSAAYGAGKLAGEYLVPDAAKSWVGDKAYDGYEAAKHSLFPDSDPDSEAYWEKLRAEHQARVAAAAASASQCHSGHDEDAHPGGCNQPR